ncbi:MAG: fasciclin domain-containing protein, partial [Gammaproteobacteria bacterium]|nr:fasciclin domain-containing protein [Gammaproteobacteria bacterium]
MKAFRNKFSSLSLAALLVLSLSATPALADKEGKDNNRWSSNTVDTLVGIKGAEALVGAVLYVEGADVLDFSLVEFLSSERFVLFAPTNSAFENLLALEPGSLAGLSASDIANALGGLVPADAVAGILLKHVVPKRKFWRGTENRLLRDGSAHAADGSELTVGVGVSGVVVNDSTIIKSNFITRNS